MKALSTFQLLEHIHLFCIASDFYAWVAYSHEISTLHQRNVMFPNFFTSMSTSKWAVTIGDFFESRNENPSCFNGVWSGNRETMNHTIGGMLSTTFLIF
jgi:hypothetical protein